MHQRIVWDAATCGGTLNYQHDEPTSFFSSSLFLSCSPGTSSSTISTWRRSRCHGRRAGDQEGRAGEEEEGGQERKAARKW